MQKKAFLLIILIFCLISSNYLNGQNISIVQPKPGQTLDKSALLIWNSIDTITEYNLIISDSPSLINPLVNQAVTGNRYNFNGQAGDYYWKVYSKWNNNIIDSSGLGNFSFVDIQQIDSLNLWLKADTGLTVVNGSITEWMDLSDSMSTVNQPTVGLQPTISQDSLGGYPMVLFDNVNDKLLTDAFIKSNNYYIVAVYNTVNPSNRAYDVIRSGTTTQGWFIGKLSGTSAIIFDGNITRGKTIAGSEFAVHGAHTLNGSLSNIVNGALIGSKSPNRTPDVLSIGGTTYIDANVAEVIAIDGSISNTERSSIDNYLMDKYSPPVNLGEDKLVCTFPIQITPHVSGYKSYAWSTGSSDSLITVSSSGVYKLTVTDRFERTSIDSILVQMDTNSNPVSLIPDTTFCLGDTIRLYAGSDLYSYNWNNGSNSNEIDVFTPGKYKVTRTNCFGVSSADSVQIDFSQPNFSIGNDTTICFYDSILLKPSILSQSIDFLWSNGSVDTSLLVKNSGLYHLKLTDQFGCEFRDSILLNSDSTLFGLSLGADTSLCEGNTLSLNAKHHNLSTYIWNTGSMDSAINVTTSQSYKLTITNSGCLFSDSVNINIKGKAPIVDFSYSDTCFSDSVHFQNMSIDPSNISINSFLWDFGDGFSSSTENPAYKYVSNGSFQVKLFVTNDSLCSNEISKNLTIEPKPTASFIFDKNCLKDSVQFTNTSSVQNSTIASSKWKFGSSLMNDSSSISSPKFKYNSIGSKQVSLEVFSLEGCADTLSKNVFVNSSPTAFYTVSDTIFEDSTTLIDKSLIANGSIFSRVFDFGFGQSSTDSVSKIVFPAIGSYSTKLKVVTDSGCVDSMIRTINIIPQPPQFNTVYPKLGQTLINNNLRFEWNKIDSLKQYRLQLSKDSNFTQLVIDSTTQKNIVILNNLQSGNLFWRVIGRSLNRNFDTTNVSNFTVLDVLSIDSLNLWINTTQGLNIVNDTVKSWEDMSDSSSLVYQPLNALQPMISGDSLNGYPLVLFDDVDDKLLTDVNITSDNYYIAAVYNTINPTNRAYDVIRSGTTTQGWFLGKLSGTSAIVFDGNITSGKTVLGGEFAVHGAHALNDTVSNVINGSIIASKKVNRSPDILSIGGTTYIDANIAEVIVIDGSIDDSTRSVIDNYLMDKYSPPIDLGEDKSVCSFPDSIEYDLKNSTSIEWSTGDTSNILRFDSIGTYYVRMTDIFGRVSVDSVYISLDTTNFVVDLGIDDSTICKGDEIELFVNNKHLVYSWNTGLNQPSIVVSDSGLYTIEVLNCKGNVSRDSVKITVNSPQFSLGSDTTICFNETLSLIPDSTFANVSYIWSTGESSPTIPADTSDVYSLTVTDSFSCSFSDTIAVTIDSAIYDITLGVDTVLCVGDQLGLRNNTIPNLSYSWSTGETTSMIQVDTAGNYTVDVSLRGCLNSDTISVQISGDVPTSDFSFSKICFNDTTEFTDLSSAVSGDQIIRWEWSFGDGQKDTTQSTSHTYGILNNYTVTLEVETDKGCIDTAQKIVNLNPLPIVNFTSQNPIKCSRSSIDFADSSYVINGAINSVSWNFGDSSSSNNTSTLSNPTHTYDTSGLYVINLKATSDQGCINDIDKNIYINPTPTIDVDIVNRCLSDSIYFKGNVDLPSDSVFDYKYFISKLGTPAIVFEGKDFTSKFIETGEYYSTFRVRSSVNGAVGCLAAELDTFQLFDNPIVDFTVPTICEGDSFQLSNNSTAVDSISNFRYTINNATFSEANPKVLFNNFGIDTIKLSVETTNGCIDSIAKEININKKPKVDFTILNNNSGIPLDLHIRNNTTDANQYYWNFGDGDTSSKVIPNKVYSDTGVYNLQLKAMSSMGCSDSLQRKVFVLPSFLEATLRDVILQENSQGELEISAQVINTGYNTIRSMQLAAAIDNRFKVVKNFNDTLYSGNSVRIVFENSFTKGEGDKIDFVCVQIESINSEVNIDDSNQEICKRAFGNELQLSVYPNPVKEILSMEYVLPRRGNVEIQFFDQNGREIIDSYQNDLMDGVYRNEINVERLNQGIYYYRFVFEGIIKSGKFLKQ